MTDLQAINLRRSARRFTQKPLDEDQAQTIKVMIHEINMQTGLRLLWINNGAIIFENFSQSYGMFKNIGPIIAMKGPEDDPNLEEKIGYHGEKIVLELTKMGLGSCWVAGAYDKKALDLPPEGERMAGVIIFGERATNPSRGLLERLIAGKRREPSHFIKSAPQEPLPPWFLAGIEAVTKAPSAHGRYRTRFAIEGGQVEAFVDQPDQNALVDFGVDKLHFEIGSNRKFELGNPGRLMPQE